MNAKRTTTLPWFPGFYHSWLSDMLDREFEQYVEYFDERQRDSYNGDDFAPAELRLDQSKISELLYDAQTDCYSAHVALSREYVGAINVLCRDNLGFDPELRFETMQSPRYYNFETDRAFAYITRKALDRFWSISRRDGHKHLAEIARERFTSRDGFSSFYSPDFADWGDVAEYDHNQICTLIEACLVAAGVSDETSDLYELVDSGNGEAYNAFCESIDWPKFERLVEEARDELRAELDPDFVLPTPRCPYTPDLFA